MKKLRQGLYLLLLTAAVMELFFVSKVLVMAVVAPQSTSFQRSEIWRVLTKTGEISWRQEWISYEKISNNLKRAVIAAEDGDFINHDGVEWEAIENAWTKNTKAKELAEKKLKKTPPSKAKKEVKAPKIIGGSTITQQLAKNLFLSGERTLLRKAEEFLVTNALELFLSKQRILEIYLNSVEWGEGVFGAEAAAQHYFRKSAQQLTSLEAARLAVMLPRPKFYEKQSASHYLSQRASTIAARMADVELP